MAGTDYQTLTLRNPSPYARGGVVVRAWQPIAQLLGRNTRSASVLRELQPGEPDTKLRPLGAQVDVLDPDDPERTQLAFALDGVIGRGDEHYVTPNGRVRVRAGGEEPATGTATVEVDSDYGVKLRNEYLELWVNTAKKRHPEVLEDFHAGSVSYVTLFRHPHRDHPVFSKNRFDALDGERSMVTWDRDPEQRAMQIDRVHLVRPPWDERGSLDAFPYMNAWTVKHASQGPVRAIVTIASAPFEFDCKDVDGSERVMNCTIFRALSIYSGEEFIGDEIWVKAVDTKTKKARRVWFTAGYFMRVNLTADRDFFRYPDHPGWFMISSLNDPYHGYAFATDARASTIWSPPLDYPHRGAGHAAYAWEIGPTRVAHNFHAFRAPTDRRELSALAGAMWYHLAFKRIRATLEGEQ
jgi:hypothetical protein